MPSQLTTEWKIKENEKRDKYLDPARELNNAMEHEGDGGTNCNWCAWNDLQKLSKSDEIIGNRRTSQDHPNYSFAKIDQNTVLMNLGDLLSLGLPRTTIK